MKKSLKVLSATLMAAVMAVSATPVFAESGTIKATFGVYSPTLTVTVPASTQIKINSAADSTARDVKKYTIASDNIVILNASTDADNKGIDVLFTANAKYTSLGSDVVAHYGAFTKNDYSTKKELKLNLSTTDKVTLAAESAADANASTNLSKAKVNAGATDAYTTKAVVTTLGAQANMQVPKPTIDSSDNNKFTAFGAASFALTGDANTNAPWENDDVAIEITYNLKASSVAVSGFDIPSSALPAATTDTITLNDTAASNLNGAKVTGVLVASEKGDYGEYLIPEENYTIEYDADEDATTPAPKYTITLDATDPGVAYLKGDYAGKTSDLVVALSDGRTIVSTLTYPAS